MERSLLSSARSWTVVVALLSATLLVALSAAWLVGRALLLGLGLAALMLVSGAVVAAVAAVGLGMDRLQRRAAR